MPPAGDTVPTPVEYGKLRNIKKLAIATIRPDSELARKLGPRVRIGETPFDRYERELITCPNRCRFCRVRSGRRQAEGVGDECKNASHSPKRSIE